MWSQHYNTKWLKSFSVPRQGQKHKSSLLPLEQGSLPKNKGSSGNNFLRRICQRGSKIHSSSKTSLFQKNSSPKFFASNFFWKNFFSVEKWKIANRLKRVLAKFRRDRSFIWGLNGRSKFAEHSTISEFVECLASKTLYLSDSLSSWKFTRCCWCRFDFVL